MCVLLITNYVILYYVLVGKIKIEVAILLGAAPIWVVGEERDRKGVVT